MWSSAQALKTARLLLISLTVLLPFHALIVTVFDAEWIRVWKEATVAGLLIVSVPLFVHSNLHKTKLGLALLVYALISFLYAFLHFEGTATLLGLRNNLGFLALFIVGFVYAQTGERKLKKTIESLLIWLGGIAALIALIQASGVISWPEFNLAGLGGGKIIQDSDIQRAYGVFSGPLQLGSFLILPLALTIRKAFNRPLWISYDLLLLLAIFFTYSRAALLAAIGVIGLSVLFQFPSFFTKKRLIIASVAIGALSAGLILVALNWRPLSLILFHAEPEKALTESSTADHFEYSAEAAVEVLTDPLGDGVGTAGPASFFSEQLVITENYFLQVGIEVGVIGMVLFIVIQTVVLKQLSAQKQIALFISGVGLVGMNLLLHTWTDIATAWSWWLLAGLSLGLAHVRTQPE